MMPLIIFYDEYIDRPKLSEQKNPFEYTVPPPPPHKRVRNKKFMNAIFCYEIDNEKQNHGAGFVFKSRTDY